jgi:2-keto-4-pentenoate hydratase
MDVDLKTLPATLSVNGEVVVTGSPEDLMWDHIFEAAGWLANHKAMAGRGLRAGDLIMTGSCTGMHPLNAGDQVTGDFGPLGKVEATFSG